MDKFTESSLNTILTSWTEHAESLRNREVLLKCDGKDIESTAIGMVADQAEHDIKSLRDTITTLRRHDNHCKTMEKMVNNTYEI